MSIKNMKRNVQSIYWIKYVTCLKILKDPKPGQPRIGPLILY